MTPKELKTALENDDAVDLLDVRPSHDYEHNHIPGAVNVPYDESFGEAVKNVFKETDVPVVVYDAHEKSDKAQNAGKVLGQAGFTVKILDGGMMAWMEAGYKVEFGRES